MWPRAPRPVALPVPTHHTQSRSPGLGVVYVRGILSRSFRRCNHNYAVIPRYHGGILMEGSPKAGCPSEQMASYSRVGVGTWRGERAGQGPRRSQLLRRRSDDTVVVRRVGCAYMVPPGHWTPWGNSHRRGPRATGRATTLKRSAWGHHCGAFYLLLMRGVIRGEIENEFRC